MWGSPKIFKKDGESHKNDSFRFKDEEYNTPLHCAIRKYGLENFKFEILERCLASELDEREKYYISFYESFPPSKGKGYNQTPGGQGPSSKIWEHLEEVDDLLKNSSLTQKEISQKFNVTEEMIQGINTGRYWRRDSIVYPIRERRICTLIDGVKVFIKWEPKMKKFCSICKAEITSKATICSKCRDANKKIPMPSKHQLLEDLFFTQNNQKVAFKYSISTVLLNKWQDELGIPRKRNLYTKMYKEEILGEKENASFKPLILKLDPVCKNVVQIFTTRKEAALSVGCNPGSTTGINEAIKNKKLYRGFYWELKSQ